MGSGNNHRAKTWQNVPFFNGIHNLYGARHNVNLPAVACYGVLALGPNVRVLAGDDDELPNSNILQPAGRNS